MPLIIEDYNKKQVFSVWDDDYTRGQSSDVLLVLREGLLIIYFMKNWIREADNGMQVDKLQNRHYRKETDKKPKSFLFSFTLWRCDTDDET